MLAVLVVRPLDPNQSGARQKKYNENMLRRNIHLRLVASVLMVVVAGARSGFSGAVVSLDHPGVMFVEVCTREGLKRVPVDEPRPDPHGTGGACHLAACAGLSPGAGMLVGGGPLLVALSLPWTAAALPRADWRAWDLLLCALRARGLPLALAMLQ